MLLNEIKPSPPLARYIRLYRIVDFRFPDAVIIPPKLYSPRPEQCLQFYPRDLETVHYPASDQVVAGKRVSFVGQHNFLQQRVVGKEFLSLQVVFQPGTFYRLTGIALHEFTNQYLDASAIFGSAVHEVNEQLFHAGSYPTMVQVVETFLSRLIKRIQKEEHPVDHCGRIMLLQEDQFALDPFLKMACLSARQFDRKFNEHLGIPPKQFLRIIRFDKAYRMKNRFPQLDWLSVAVRCGYHDYQHLAKDYKDFTGYTPPHFYALDLAAPERAFGDADT